MSPHFTFFKSIINTGIIVKGILICLQHLKGYFRSKLCYMYQSHLNLSLLRIREVHYHTYLIIYIKATLVLRQKILSWFVITWNSNMKVSRAEKKSDVERALQCLLFCFNDIFTEWQNKCKYINMCSHTNISFGSVVYKLRNLFGYAFLSSYFD